MLSTKFVKFNKKCKNYYELRQFVRFACRVKRGWI